MNAPLKKTYTLAVPHAWNDLPDIENVSSALSTKDHEFFKSIGQLLSKTKQTSRLAITLLHSHFPTKPSEILVEEQINDQIATTVQEFDVEQITNNVPKSWMFQKERPASGKEELLVLTWASPSNLSAPLTENDEILLHAIASLYRRANLTTRFGMALAGAMPSTGMVWVEGTNVDERFLVQEQLPLEEVELRNPIRTMWVFDVQGNYTITLGCCVQGPSKRGHMGTKHPWGVEL